MTKVFLGGTCNDSKWRDKLIPHLTIDYFNPVVDDWNEESQAKEIQERESSDFVLYTLTPKMKGFYSVAEVVDDSNKRPDKTILCILSSDEGTEFPDDLMDSMDMLIKMVKQNGAKVVYSLTTVKHILNNG